MPQRPQLALYENEAEMYITNLVTRQGITVSDTEKRKTRKALSEITAILHVQGHSWPDKSDYDAYRHHHEDNKETRQNVSRIEKFFAWLKEKETETMPETNTTATIDAETAQAELFTENDTATWPVSNTENEPVQKVKGKGGRKRLDGENGEIRSEKITVYLTPTQADALKAVCSLDKISSVAECINSLINKYIKDNKDDINGFFSLRAKREKHSINNNA